MFRCGKAGPPPASWQGLRSCSAFSSEDNTVLNAWHSVYSPHCALRIAELRAVPSKRERTISLTGSETDSQVSVADNASCVGRSSLLNRPFKDDVYPPGSRRPAIGAPASEAIDKPARACSHVASEQESRSNASTDSRSQQVLSTPRAYLICRRSNATTSTTPLEPVSANKDANDERLYSKH